MVEASRVVAIRDLTFFELTSAPHYDCMYYAEEDDLTENALIFKGEFLYDRYWYRDKAVSRYNTVTDRWGFIDSLEKLIDRTPFGLKLITDPKEIRKFLMIKEMEK